MKKLFVFDLDGTLLNSKSEISEKNKKMINKCKEKGHYIAYITGRGTVKTIKFTKGMARDAYACNNGSQIFCEENLVKKNCLDFNTVKKFLKDECENKEFFIVMEPVKYLNYDDPKIDNIDYFKADTDGLPQKDVDMISLRDYTGIDVEKYQNNFNIKKAGKTELMINSKNATKTNALQTIAKYFNIDKKDIISFGDDFSDIEVFKNSGESVAMGNAIDELKQISTYVIEDNDSDSIAEFLRKYMEKIKMN